MAKLKQKNDNNGFTLVEALVTISIMLILTVMILSGLTQAKQRFLVRDSAQQFANLVRQTIADTRNGVKVHPSCVNDAAEPRRCSNYVLTVIDSNTVEKMSPAMWTLKFNIPLMSASAQFAYVDNVSKPMLWFRYATDTFPRVLVQGANDFAPSGTATITVRIKSASDPNIFSNVCIYSSNVVVVRSDDCD